MACTTKPEMAIRQLAGPGEVALCVHVDGQFAIVSTSANDPQKRLMLAALDTGANAFMHRMYNGQTALVFPGQYVFEPDVSAPIALADPTMNSGASAFADDDGAYVVVRLMNGTDWRLLHIETGHIVSWNHAPMHMFPHWRLSVDDGAGRLTALLQV